MGTLILLRFLIAGNPAKRQRSGKVGTDGAVVLLHSTSATNARILDELLAKWEALGYRFASLEELAGERAE